MKGNTLRKTKHFDERWIERIGGDPPTLQEISKILDNSVMIQNSRKVFTPRGQPILILALYWNHDLQLVLKVDRISNTLVTVLTPKLLKNRKNKGENR